MSKRQRRRVATRRATHMRRAGQKLPVALAVVAAPAVVPAAAEAAHHHAAISMGSSAPHLISRALASHPLPASPHPYAAHAGQVRFHALSHEDALTRAELRFRAERALSTNAFPTARRPRVGAFRSVRTASLPTWARGLPHARRFQVATSPGLLSDSSGSRSGESTLGSAGAALDPTPSAAEPSSAQPSGAEASNPATPPVSANPFPQVSAVIPAPAPPPGPPEEFGATLYTPSGGGGLTAVHSSEGQNYLKGELGVGEDASVTWGGGPSIEAPTQELKLEASAQIPEVLSVEASVPLTGGEPGASPEVKAVVNLPVPEGTPEQSIGFSWSPKTGLQNAGEIEAPIEDATVEVPVNWKVDVSGVVQVPQLPDFPALFESTAREIVPSNTSPEDQSSPPPDQAGIPVGNGIPTMDGSGAFVTIGTPGGFGGPSNSDQPEGGGLDLSNTGSLGDLQLDAGTQTDSPGNAATQSDSPSSAAPQTDSSSNGSDPQSDPNTWQPITSLQPVVTQTDAGTLTQSNPDGTIVQQNPAGVRTLTNPDGTSVCYDACTGTVTTVDGQGTTQFQPDGSISQVNNGQTTVWDSSGNGYLIDPVTGAPTSTATPPPAAPSIPDPVAPVADGGGGSTPDQTVTPAATDTPTPTDTSTPTSTPNPTDTSAPAPTDTSAPATTDTSAPAPTDTSAPAPTDTSTPTDTSAPTPSPSPDTSGGSSSSDSSSGGGDSSGGSSDSGGGDPGGGSSDSGGGDGGGGAFTAG
jgi:hypothetical protein